MHAYQIQVQVNFICLIALPERGDFGILCLFLRFLPGLLFPVFNAAGFTLQGMVDGVQGRGHVLGEFAHPDGDALVIWVDDHHIGAIQCQIVDGIKAKAEQFLFSLAIGAGPGQQPTHLSLVQSKRGENRFPGHRGLKLPDQGVDLLGRHVLGQLDGGAEQRGFAVG